MPNNEATSAWDVLESDYLIRRPWLNVRRERLRLPNGNEIPEYYVLECPDGVGVVAITEDGKLVLERLYRHGLGRMTWEIPCGMMEETDESPLAGAQRELLEETGYGGGEWTPLDTLSGNAGIMNNLTHCFLARGVKKLCEQHLDVGESLETKLVPLEAVPAMLLRGDFYQSLHVAPLWKFFWMQKNSVPG